MKVLVLGSGGREHALGWAISRSPHRPEILALPGNPGLAELGRCLPGDPTDAAHVEAVARREGADLVVVGPEAPLVAGVADRLRRAGIPVFGPDEQAARIEGSKVFAKTLMREEGIPTAAFEVFSKADEALAFLERRIFPVVLKVDGLAAGKGAFVCRTLEEAREVVERVLVQRAFGAAGERLVVEQFLEGEEVSVFAVTDGDDLLLLPPSQDYKAIGEGDTGPNTGGMGATCPVVGWSPALEQRVLEEILRPVLAALRRRDRPFRGLLYAGVMVREERAWVLEFNCRFGDPETQAVLPLLEGDLLEALLWSAGVRREKPELRHDGRAAAVVVLASSGYPGAYPKGLPIEGIEKAREIPGALVFHAGTAWAAIAPGGRAEPPFRPTPALLAGEPRERPRRLVTAGGRVLNVVGVAEDIPSALRRAYEAASLIHFEGKTFRRDIGHRALRRLKGEGA
jgi:phosphoribosylamine--glycine ligase